MLKDLLRFSLSLLLLLNISILVSCESSTRDSAEFKELKSDRAVGEARCDRNTSSCEINHAMGTTTITGTPQRDEFETICSRVHNISY